MEKLRVLIVEDSLKDIEMIMLRLMEEDLQPECLQAQTETECLAELETNPDLILANCRLPHFSGQCALQLVNESDLDIPFEIISGSIGEEAAIDAIHLEADDYVLKDHLARLGQAVRHVLE